MPALAPTGLLAVVVATAAALGPATAAPAGPGPARDDDETLASLRAEAGVLAPAVGSDAARAFLAQVPRLPPPEARTVHRGEERWLSAAEAEALSEEERAALTPQELPARTYYLTRYGSPLAYTRPLDLLGAAGLDGWEGRRVLDLGYGTVGHLRLLALAGADVTGVDVDSWLTALYAEPGDQGPVEGGGRVQLVEGRWPAEDAARAAIGTGYDVFLSKNTLKRGYIHPTREADPRQLIDLGVDDATFLARLHELLVPGGLALLYNICPPEAAEDAPYVPWADGRSPFTREQWEAAGFELLALDAVDDAEARAQGVRLGWGEAADLEQGIFCWYTLAQRLPDDGDATDGSGNGDASDDGEGR